MLSRAVLVGLLCCAVARGDNSTPAPTPAPAPACHSAMWRAGERAFADYCRGRSGRGVHGSCADWLRAYRRCESLGWERAESGWLAVLDLFDCHAVVVELGEESGHWRVRNIKMRSHLHSMPMPPGPNGDILQNLELSPSPR
jgi:hypothetical protein